MAKRTLSLLTILVLSDIRTTYYNTAKEFLSNYITYVSVAFKKMMGTRTLTFNLTDGYYFISLLQKPYFC